MVKFSAGVPLHTASIQHAILWTPTWNHCSSYALAKFRPWNWTLQQCMHENSWLQTAYYSSCYHFRKFSGNYILIYMTYQTRSYKYVIEHIISYEPSIHFITSSISNQSLLYTYHSRFSRLANYVLPLSRYWKKSDITIRVLGARHQGVLDKRNKKNVSTENIVYKEILLRSVFFCIYNVTLCYLSYVCTIFTI